MSDPEKKHPTDPEEKKEESSTNKPSVVQPPKNIASEFDIPEEVLADIPLEDRNKIKSVFQKTIFGMFSGRVPNPIMDKITSDHITTLIKNADTHDQRDRRERVGIRYFQLAIIIIVLVFIGLLVYVFKDNKDVMIGLISGLMGFGGGFGIGKLYKKSR